MLFQVRRESERILDRLKELHDAGANDYDQLFSKTTLENTFVISLDNLESGLTEAQMMHLRLEDIPSSRISIIRLPEASPRSSCKGSVRVSRSEESR